MIFLTILLTPLAIFLALLYREHEDKSGKYATESDKAIVAKVLKAFETPRIEWIAGTTHPTGSIDYYADLDVRFIIKNKDYLISTLLTDKGHDYFAAIFPPVAKKWEEDWRAAVKDQRIKEVLQTV